MLLACPACNARYDVPDRLIGNGRRLRCARCEHDWMVHPVTVAPAAPPPLAAAPRPPAAAPTAAPMPDEAAARGGAGLWLAWGASLLAMAALLAGLWLYRGELSAAWPPMARLYGWLGA